MIPEGFRMPAEYEPHSATIIVFPEREGSWTYKAEPAQRVFAEIIKKLTFLNTEDGLKQCLNDADFYLDIVRTFVEDNAIEDLKKFYYGNDWSGYRVKVHSLKSSSAYIGAEELREKAKRMEEAAKKQDVEYINLHHHQLPLL